MRDELLGRPLADRDFVVVGATPEQMLARGFRPVGRDFPVFLHPETHEEYALARTERKTGRGHRGFSFDAAPSVTLEEDLARRDLTINAMARDDDGTLIDPFGGAADLRAGVLRHVGPAFAEDPLRVLRVARFAAYLDFALAPETEALMRTIAAGGELSTLTAERIWQELARALMAPKPSRFFAALRRCGALAGLLPEVDAVFGQAQRDGVLDAGVHRLRALDCVAAAGEALAVRYAVLACGPGSPAPAQVMRSVRQAIALGARLKVPTDCRDLARLCARYAPTLERAAELSTVALLDFFLATDALRRPERFAALVRASGAVRFAGAEPARAAAIRARLGVALGVVRAVDAGAQALRAGAAGDVARRVRTARLRALRAWLQANPA